MRLSAEILPENTTDKTITWTSSDESVVTVSTKGIVKAVAAGEATVTATSSNGIKKAFPSALLFLLKVSGLLHPSAWYQTTMLEITGVPVSPLTMSRFAPEAPFLLCPAKHSLPVDGLRIMIPILTMVDIPKPWN